MTATIVIYDRLYEPIDTIELYHCLRSMKKIKGRNIMLFHFISTGNSLYVKVGKVGNITSVYEYEISNMLKNFQHKDHFEIVCLYIQKCK